MEQEQQTERIYKECYGIVGSAAQKVYSSPFTENDMLNINFSRLRYAIDLLKDGQWNEQDYEAKKSIQLLALDLLLAGTELRKKEEQ